MGFQKSFNNHSEKLFSLETSSSETFRNEQKDSNKSFHFVIVFNNMSNFNCGLQFACESFDKRESMRFLCGYLKCLHIRSHSF